MLAMLSTCAKDNLLDWGRQVRDVFVAYNTSMQTFTYYIPFFSSGMMYAIPNNASQSLNKYETILGKQMGQAFPLERKYSLTKQKEIYDKSSWKPLPGKGLCVATFFHEQE